MDEVKGAAVPTGELLAQTPQVALPIPLNNVEEVDIDNEPNWEEEPKVSFDERATLRIAGRVVGIFGAVYFLCFVMAFCMFFVQDVKFEGMLELVKFLLTSIIPLVTLAVGYYLGDKGSGNG